MRRLRQTRRTGDSKQEGMLTVRSSISGRKPSRSSSVPLLVEHNRGATKERPGDFDTSEYAEVVEYSYDPRELTERGGRHDADGHAK